MSPRGGNYTSGCAIPSYEHLIIAPIDGPANEEVLIAVAPGAFLPPDAFKSLAAEIQASTPHLRTYVGVLSIDTLSLMQLVVDPALINTPAAFEAFALGMKQGDVYSILLQQLLDQAVAAGFKPRKEGRGGHVRVCNLMLLAQSAGGMGFPEAAMKLAGGTMLLASTPNAEEYPKRRVVSLETCPGPLLIISGELDGQMRWPWHVPYIAETAAMATKFGERYVARNAPLLVLPGINHGNTSNGIARTVRGDITADVAPYEECIQVLGRHIGAFITAHMSRSTDARTEAETFLVEALRKSFVLTAPYCKALGLGDTSAPFTAGGDGRPHAHQSGPLRVGGMVAAAARVAGHVESTAIMPGIVVAAESHTEELQRRVLQSLPPPALERVTVVASCHTELGTFSQNHATMTELGDNKWLLRVHVLLNFRSLESSRPHICSYAAEHWVKLLSAERVAQALGLPDAASYDTPKPAELNRETHADALAAAPEAVAARYLSMGRKMVFEDDLDVLAQDGVSIADTDGRLDAVERVFREMHIAYRHPQPAADGVPAPGGPPARPLGPPAAMLVTGSFSGSMSSPQAVLNAAAAAVAAAAATPKHAITPGSLGTVRVGSPFVVLPAGPASGKSSGGSGASGFGGSGSLEGSFCAKVLSLPLVMEWIWLDCLRETDTAW
ncbi:hypothetical protein HYH02_004138 [Chlamydomonas schloesseri]|uniref:Uncharacterized protein n=1 Tax=Chlamydomonas schloesseri TaxID=2026947 RepID=A0A835WPZ3_9CHLO|nr:hypothetical protein HYH02_004138 [Chlamydomonas schloesseri]|eukprot:KAG2451540.1 hypothetical protein HYH02_004138 [Chlamydomonas schloesseri]